MRPSAAQVNNSFPSQNDIQLLTPFLHSYQPLHPNRFWVRSYCPRRLIQHQLDLHWPIPKKSWFWLKQQMFPKWQKMWVLPSYPWCCRSIFLKILDSIQLLFFIWLLTMLGIPWGNTGARAGIWQSPYWKWSYRRWCSNYRLPNPAHNWW